MLKKVISLLISVMIVVMSAQMLAKAENKITLYVSENGNDSADGIAAMPLGTLEGARKKLRELRGEDTSIPAEVIFKGGTYRFSEGVKFSELDSGEYGANVVYRASDGEKVYFKGSMKLDAEQGKPVTDKDILNRMYPEAADKVVQFDLKKQGFPYKLNIMKNIKYSYSLGGEQAKQEYVNLYLNGNAQMIAQWPNGDENFVQWVEAVEKGDTQGGSKPGSFRYAEDNPSRWLQADNAWIGGYHAYDYKYERTSLGSIDTVNKIIKLASPATSGVCSVESRRWKIYNLLEEIDTPGEWFIDVNTMILYYYPPQTLKGVSLEIACLDDHMVTMKNCKNITFEGIEFSQTRRLAFHMTDVSDITINKCRFINMESGAIFTEGIKEAQTDSHWWQRQKIDAVYNTQITNCTFYNIGDCAIDLKGGNVDTLKSGNNKIENCFLSRIATNNKNAAAIILRGCGNSCIKNTIGGTSFHAITYYGNDHMIKYNEIFNVNRTCDDVGVIYCGRNYVHRGDEIAYNFIHDVEPILVQSRGFNPAIYWDDSASGQTAHHNIIVNALIGVYFCGQKDIFNNNTIVNAKRLGLNISNNYQNKTRIATWTEAVANIKNPQLYFDQYPKMDIGYTDKWGDKNAFNEVCSNLVVSSEDNNIASSIHDYGKFENNVITDTCDDFVDPENLDYRIKSNSETAKKLPELLNENFDLEKIGADTEYLYNSETASFRQIYPKNGTRGIESKNVEFSWENAEGANKYRLIIATDPEMQNKVFEEESYYNRVTVPYLEQGKTYYWKVSAKCLARKNSDEWESSSVPYMLTTAMFDKIDTKYLEQAISEAESKLSGINEGVENGDYKEGTKAEFEKLIQTSKKLVNAKVGTVTQQQIDTKTTELAQFLSDKVIRKPGYLNMRQYITDKSLWANTVEIKDGAVTVDGKKTQCNGIKVINEISENTILCFKAKLDTDGWLGIGLSLQPTAVLYGSGNAGYFFAIKDSVVEFQKNPSNKSKIIETKELKLANDGIEHEYQIGVIKLGAGNLITFNVDGENVYEYVDAEDDYITKDLAFCLELEGNTKVTFYPNDNIPDNAVFTELISKAKQELLNKVWEKYPDAENLIILKVGCKTIVQKDKETVNTDVAPVIENNRTLVPLRAVAEIFGADVEWENGKAIIAKEDKKIEFVLTDKYYYVNEQKYELDQAAVIRDNRMMIPVRAVSDALEKDILWDELTGLIFIGDKIGIEQMNSKPLLAQTEKLLLTLEEKE